MIGEWSSARRSGRLRLFRAELNIERSRVALRCRIRPPRTCSIRVECASLSPNNRLPARHTIAPSAWYRRIERATRRSGGLSVRPLEDGRFESTLVSLLALDLRYAPITPYAILLSRCGHPNGILVSRVTPLCVGVRMVHWRVGTCHGRKLNIEICCIGHLLRISP